MTQRVVSASILAQFRAFSFFTRQISSTVLVFFTFVWFITTRFGVRISDFSFQARTLERAGCVQTLGTRMTRILNTLVDVLTTDR